MTANGSSIISHPPSVWLAACHTPEPTFDHRSHFGATRASTGTFRFNVVHMDGHVHDAQWNEPWTAGHWGVSEGSGKGRPYGWKWKPSKDDGVEMDSDFSGAYDMNP
jgi:hypothetical protein